MSRRQCGRQRDRQRAENPFARKPMQSEATPQQGDFSAFARLASGVPQALDWSINRTWLRFTPPANVLYLHVIPESFRLHDYLLNY